MWVHLDSPDYNSSNAGVAISDMPNGKFNLISCFRPIHYDYGININDEREAKMDEKGRGNTFRDMNLFVDEDGKAYVYYASENNKTMYIVRLNNDYTDIEKPALEGRTWSRALPSKNREAPTPFKYQGKYYLITSGLTGWAPNAAECFVSDSILGPYKSKGNPCSGGGFETTFEGQSTYVLAAPGKGNGFFIFIADRWNGADLVHSTHIWLPFYVDNKGDFSIEFYPKWNLSIFDKTDLTLNRPEVSSQKITNDQYDTYRITWNTVQGSSSYKVYANGKNSGVSMSNEFVLPFQLAGRAIAYTVTANRLTGESSLPSEPVIINWVHPADIYLSDCDADNWKQGYGILKKDCAIEGKIKIAGKEFSKGLGTHAISEIIYYTSGQYGKFTAWVGCDSYPSFTKVSSMIFKVYGDGKILFESGLMKIDTPAERVDISIKGIQELKLVVDDAGDGNNYDHADWAEAKIWK
jgi:hypothetical protein